MRTVDGRRILPVLLTLTLAAGAQAQNVLQDAFTSVSVNGNVPYLVTDLFSANRTVDAEVTIGGNTVFSFTADSPDNWTPGEVEGNGWADTASLAATLELRGTAAIKGNLSARTHDVLTITAPGVATGTPGMVTYYFSLGADVTVKQFEGPEPSRDFTVASASFGVRKYTDNGAGGVAVETVGGKVIELLTSDSLGTASGEVFLPRVDVPLPPSLYAVDVPFNFGESFGLSISLGLSGETDHVLGSSGTDADGYFELWGGGVVEELKIDAGNTLDLVGILSTAHPEASIVGVDFDYSDFVTDTEPQVVPLPPAIVLLGSVLLVLATQLRRALPERCLNPH